MDESKITEILNKRCWSVIRRAQFVAGTIGAFVTVAMLFLRTLNLSPLVGDTVWYYWFTFYMAVMWPAAKINDILGIAQGTSVWLWNFLAVGANTVVCFLVGTLIGWLISKFKKEKVSVPSF